MVFSQVYYTPYPSYYWGWNLGGAFLSFVFFVFLVWLVFRLLRGHNHYFRENNQRNPIDIAKERYAKGELAKEEFDQIKKDIKD